MAKELKHGPSGKRMQPKSKGCVLVPGMALCSPLSKPRTGSCHPKRLLLPLLLCLLLSRGPALPLEAELWRGLERS